MKDSQDNRRRSSYSGDLYMAKDESLLRACNTILTGALHLTATCTRLTENEILSHLIESRQLGGPTIEKILSRGAKREPGKEKSESIVRVYLYIHV